MNIQHSSRTDEWYTPLDMIVLSKQVLNSIDLDPATCEYANARIQATYFFTRETDGLGSIWPQNCSVFCNPPGGKIGNKSHTGLFWQKLMSYKSAGHLKEAIFLCFSIEAAQSTQGKGNSSVMEFPICVPSKRLHFDSQHGKFSAPAHSNLIVYVPGTVDNTEKFLEVFRPVGVTKR